jgi:hypothetical protein
MKFLKIWNEDKNIYQKVICLLGQLGFGQRDGEEDCNDTDDVSRVADEPVKPVKDRTSWSAGVTPEERHEWLNEAKTRRNTTEDLE